MKHWIYLLVFLVAYNGVHAQDPMFNNISKLNGLPSNTVYHIVQDQQGFIWVGQDKGLSRYDGKQFKHYSNAYQQGKSLSNLLEIGNTIWCQDFSGNFFYVLNDSLIKETALNNKGLYLPAGKWNDSVLLILNLKELTFFNIYTKRKKQIQAINKNINAIDYTSKQPSFITKNTLYSITKNAASVQFKLIDSSKVFAHLVLTNNAYYALTKDTYPYLHLLNHSGTRPINILYPNLFIQNVSVLENEIWVCTTTGAFCFTKTWQPKYGAHNFLKDMSVSKVMLDREGNYWFSTLNKGLITIPNIDIKLFKYNAENFTSVTTAQETLLIGTSSKSVLQFNGATKTFSSIFKGNSNHEVIHILNDSPMHQYIFCSNKIDVFNSLTKKNYSLPFAGKNVIVLNKDFYVASFSVGITLFRRNNSTANVPNWLSGGEWLKGIYSILNYTTRTRWVSFNTRDSTLFAATTSGLLYFSPKGRGVIQCNGKDIFASQIEITNNGVYAATFSDGLIYINQQLQASIVPNSAIAKTIYKLKSVNNYLWLLAEDILQKYDVQKNTITNYTHTDGLPKAEFKDFVVHNNQVIIATTDGLVFFNDSLNNQQQSTPTLALNKFLVNNQIQTSTQNVEFSHTQNNIEINFSFLSFKDQSNKEKIEYKVNNENWQLLNANARTLSLPSLSPGEYTIQIRAFTEKGIASKNILLVSFTIHQPFYKQLWFILLVITCTAFVVYLFFKYRLKTIQQKNELLSQKIILEQELQQSLLSSIKSQMNPHFLFNALNTIQSYIYTNDKENASIYLGKFSSLTRMVLEMSNKDMVALVDEIKALKLYVELEQLRFEDKLVYHFTVDENISIETTYIPSMLIQPYIENAIKHGLLHKKNNWILNIDFKLEHKQLLVTINDNGIGRKRSYELNKAKSRHQSFASVANEKRLSILNRGLNENIGLNIIDKADENNQPAGTTVQLIIPIEKK